MKAIWSKLTLLDFATEENDGLTKPMHWAAVAGLAALVMVVISVAQWIVQN